MASQPVYQFYAELLYYEPIIWRRFQVLSNITMSRLGYILMSMFEMKASHLFCFDVPCERNIRKQLEEFNDDIDETVDRIISNVIGQDKHFEIITPDTLDDYEEVLDVSQYKVKNAVSNPKDIMIFTYDFGDNWQIHLVLEEVIVDKDLPGRELPRVLEGEGYGIIEDCGSTMGLEEMAKAFKKKKGAVYEDYHNWLGCDDLDLTTFDIADANFRLKKVPRIYENIYERYEEPTQDTIDFLERKYLQKSKKKYYLINTNI